MVPLADNSCRYYIVMFTLKQPIKAYLNFLKYVYNLYTNFKKFWRIHLKNSPMDNVVEFLSIYIKCVWPCYIKATSDFLLTLARWQQYLNASMTTHLQSSSHSTHLEESAVYTCVPYFRSTLAVMAVARWRGIIFIFWVTMCVLSQGRWYSRLHEVVQRIYVTSS